MLIIGARDGKEKDNEAGVHCWLPRARASAR